MANLQIDGKTIAGISDDLADIMLDVFVGVSSNVAGVECTFHAHQNAYDQSCIAPVWSAPKSSGEFTISIDWQVPNND